MNQLLISNANIATSSEVFWGGLLIEGESIAQIYKGDMPTDLPKSIPVLNADGGYILPGGVDVHTHFDLDVGFTRTSDNFYSGTVAAACGGTTTIVDHPAFGPKGCALTYQIEQYRGLAAEAVVDYGFHGVIQHVNDGVLQDMQRLRDDYGISSLKLYLTYDAHLNDAEVLAVLEEANRLGMLVCAHCENHAMIDHLRHSFIAQGLTQPKYHPKSRPPQAEAEAVFRFLMLADIAGEAPVYIVHLSSALSLAALQNVRSLGRKNIYAETCPPYLVLNDDAYNNDTEGLKYILSPPLRKTADQSALWAALKDDALDTIGTDHCSFFFESQKQRGAQDCTLCPNGMPGVELRMALLFSEGVRKGRITLPQMVRLCSTNPARLFGLSPKKGDIALGADADLVWFDANDTTTVTQGMMHEKTDYTPYEGMQLSGRIKATLLRGGFVYKNGEFTGQKGGGLYLRRGPVQPAL